MSVQERLKKLVEKVKGRKRILRPLDQGDREALLHLAQTVQAVTKDGRISAEDIEILGLALEVLREERADTP